MSADCTTCENSGWIGLPDWSTMPCAACVRYGMANVPTMYQPRNKTNFDRIISQTPEELGKTLASLIWHWKCCDTEADTAQDLIDWLYKEAEE